MKEETESPLMDVPETVKHTHLAKATVRDLIYKRKIPYIKLGGRVFFRRSDIEAWINASEVPAHPVKPKKTRKAPKTTEAR